MLLYYENEYKSKAKGVIDLSDGGIEIVPADPAARRPSGSFADVVLQIRTPNRTYTLWPKENEDLLPWQAALSPLQLSTSLTCSPASPRATGASTIALPTRVHRGVLEAGEHGVEHLFSTPMKMERLAQCYRRLGVHAEEEPHLAWLVHEAERVLSASSPVLPPDWHEVRDQNAGQVYYHNSVLPLSTWEHPLGNYFEHLLAVLREHSLRDLGREDDDEGTGSPGNKADRGWDRGAGGEADEVVQDRRVGLGEMLVALFGEPERQRQAARANEVRVC